MFKTCVPGRPCFPWTSILFQSGCSFFLYLMFFPCSPGWPSPHHSLASGFSVPVFLECPTMVDLGGHPLFPHCSQDIALDVWMGLVLFLFFVPKWVLFAVYVCGAGCRSQDLMRTRQVLYHWATLPVPDPLVLKVLILKVFAHGPFEVWAHQSLLMTTSSAPSPSQGT